MLGPQTYSRSCRFESLAMCWFSCPSCTYVQTSHIGFSERKPHFITADSDCSHEIKGCLLLWRKAMKNLHSLLKSKDSIFLTKVYLVKAMVFSVVVYGCDSWMMKAEHWRTDAFKLWCWKRLLRVPWTAKRSNQSILKKINPEYSLEVLMLKLKLQIFGHLMKITDSLEKTVMLGKIEGRRRRGQQRMR